MAQSCGPLKSVVRSSVARTFITARSVSKYAAVPNDIKHNGLIFFPLFVLMTFFQPRQHLLQMFWTKNVLKMCPKIPGLRRFLEFFSVKYHTMVKRTHPSSARRSQQTLNQNPFPSFSDLSWICALVFPQQPSSSRAESFSTAPTSTA